MPPALLAALGCGFTSAVLYLAVLTGSWGGMVLVYLAPLPLFVAGLGFGTAAMALASGVAVIAVTVIAGSLVLGGTFALLSVAPVLLLVRQGLLSRSRPDETLEWYPPGLLLVALTGLGGAIVLVVVLVGMAFGGEDGLRGLIQGVLVESLTALFPGKELAAIDPSGLAAANLVATALPGIVVVSWLGGIMVNGLLAQGVVARFERLIRPPLRMVDLELPGWAPLVLAVTLGGAFGLGGQAGFALVNLAIVLAVPFFFAGLAVVHAFAGTRRSKTAILSVFYLVLTFLAWPVIAVIGLGIIEQWAGLRRQFLAAPPDRGEA
ncbi:MAG: DUF2232 domain-containing protein [Rhodospirillaceae bacterium]